MFNIKGLANEDDYAWGSLDLDVLRSQYQKPNNIWISIFIFQKQVSASAMTTYETKTKWHYSILNKVQYQ